ncbi:N-acetylmuramoyl-L-alanine amidase, partial [Bacteriovoracaceae bacterium]|nr:N-acetylmuramoyl-L-alanine amidase [Bacteriovoracaceae bacterium]
QSELTKYRLAYAGNLFSFGRNNNSRYALEKYLDHIEKDIDILKNVDPTYEDQFNHLMSLRPTHLSNDKLADFIELVSVLMEDQNSNLFKETAANTGLGGNELAKQWKSYGLKKSDAHTANLLNELQVRDPNSDAARLSLSKEYSRDFRKRKELRHQDLRFFSQLQNKIWQGKDRKGAGLSYSSHKHLDFNGDKKISFDEVDNDFKNKFESLIKQSQYCDSDILSEDCFGTIIDKPTLLNEDVIKLLEIKAGEFNFSRGKVTAKGGQVEVRKDFHRWKGIKASCFKSFEDDHLPTIDFSNLPQTEEYFLIYKEEGFDKEEIRKKYNGRGSKFRKTKREEASAYLEEQGFEYLHVTNELILGGETRVYTDFGNSTDREESRRTIMDSGKLNVPIESAKNFALVSRYGNKPVFFDECGKKTKNPSIKNPLSSMHDYYENVESMSESLRIAEEAINSNKVNAQIISENPDLIQNDKVQEIIVHNHNLAETEIEKARRTEAAAQVARHEYNNAMETVEGREVLNESGEEPLDGSKVDDLSRQKIRIDDEISASEAYVQQIEDQISSSSSDITGPAVLTKKDNGSIIFEDDSGSHEITTGKPKVSYSSVGSSGENLSLGFELGQPGVQDSFGMYKIDTSQFDDYIVQDGHGQLFNVENIKKWEDEINGMSTNEERIHKFYTTNLSQTKRCKSRTYSIVNKKEGTLTVYSILDGSILKQIPILTGKKDGDTKLTWDDPKRFKTNESTTPAGNFTVKPNRGEQRYLGSNYKDYNYNLLPLVDDKGNEGIFALHQAPVNSRSRYNALNNGGNSRMTNGCINVTENHFHEIESIIPGCKIHILPDEFGGKFVAKDGVLKFHYSGRAEGYEPKKYNITPANKGKSNTAIHINTSSGFFLPLEEDVAMVLETQKPKLRELYNLSDALYNELAHLTMATMELECESGAGARKYTAKMLLSADPKGDGELMLRTFKALWRWDRSEFSKRLSRGCGQNKFVPEKIEAAYGIKKTGYNHMVTALVTFGAIAEMEDELKAIEDNWRREQPDCHLLNYRPRVNLIRFLYRGGSGARKLRACDINTETSPTLGAVSNARSGYSVFAHLEGNFSVENAGRGQDTRLGLYDQQGIQVIPHNYVKIAKSPPGKGYSTSRQNVYDGFMENGLCERIISTRTRTGYDNKVIAKGMNIDGNCILDPAEVEKKLVRFYGIQYESIGIKVRKKLEEPTTVTRIPQSQARVFKDDFGEVDFVVYKENCYKVDDNFNVLKKGFSYINECFFSTSDLSNYLDNRAAVSIALYQDFTGSDLPPEVVPKYGLEGWNNRLLNENDGEDILNQPTIIPGRQVVKDRLEPKKAISQLKYIVVHHTADIEGVELNPETLLKSQISGRGYGDVAYNYIIDDYETSNGKFKTYEGRSLKIKAAGVNTGNPNPDISYNEEGIHIVLIGNFNQRAPSAAALSELKRMIKHLTEEYGIPQSNVIKHRSVDSTDCPGNHFPSLNSL